MSYTEVKEFFKVSEDLLSVYYLIVTMSRSRKDITFDVRTTGIN